MSDAARGVPNDAAGPWGDAATARRPIGVSALRLPLIDRIWRVRGTVPLNPALSPEEAFARLDPLLRTSGTTIMVQGDSLTYSKDNPAAQDKLATFTRGSLRVEQVGAEAVLRFDLFSHALLLCFLAPLMFLGFAQMAVAINAWEGPAEDIAEKAKDKPKPIKVLNPVDEFLGAPAPDDPNQKKKDEKEEEGRHSPNKGYFMAGVFALIYIVGRWLEPWLVRRRFKAALVQPSGTL